MIATGPLTERRAEILKRIESRVDGVWAMMADPEGLHVHVETNFPRLAEERWMGPAFRDLIEQTVA